MPGEGISIGDAVFHFLGDTQKLDDAFAHAENRATQASQKMASGFSGFDDAVERVRAGFVGFDGIPAEVEQINPPVDRVKVNLRSARGEAALLGEEFGIHLPRHVRNFIAELPGVGAALEAAFAATAVVFIGQALVEGIVKAVEVVEKYRKHAKEVEDAWNSVGNAGRDALSKIGDEVLAEQIKIDDLNHNHVAALHDRLLLIDHASLKELGAEFDALGKKVDETFKQAEKGSFFRWLIRGEGTLFADDGMQKAQKELEEFTKKYDTLISKQDELGASSLLASQIDKVKTKVDELNAEKKKGEIDQTELDGQTHLLNLLQEQLSVHGEIAKKRVDEQQVTTRDENAKAAGEQAAVAKQRLDSIIASLDAQVAKAHEYYQKGEIDAVQWLDAQVMAAAKASQAHTEYFDRLKELYKDDPLKEAAISAERYQSQQKLITKTTDDLVSSTKTLNEEFRKMAEEQAKRNFSEQEKDLKAVGKAALDYAKSLRAIADATEVADDATKKTDYAAREAKIKELADFGVISELQKVARLKALYEEERKSKKKELDEDAAEEEKAEIEARDRVLAAQKSGDIKQINEAKAALNGILAAEKDTYAKREKEQQDFNAKTQKLSKDEANALIKSVSSWKGFFEVVDTGSLKAGQAIKNMGALTAQGLLASAEAAVSGASTFGQAMEKWLASALQAFAGEATVQALRHYALGVGDAASPLPNIQALAPGEFVDAELWAAVAAAAGIGGAAIGASGGGGGGSSSSTGGSPNGQGDTAGTITQPVQQPGRTTTVQGGSLISPQTLAMIGSTFPASSSSQNDMPIDHPDNVAAMARAMKSSGYLPEPAATGNQIHVHVKGMISPDNLTKVVRDINKKVKNNQLTLHASNSYRVTRRSL